MKQKRPLSAGSVLILLTAVLVLGGCLLMLSKMRNADKNVQAEARAFMSAVDSYLTGRETDSPSASPTASVRSISATVISASTPLPTAAPPTDTPQPKATAEAGLKLTLTAAGLTQFRSGITETVIDGGTADYAPVLSAIAPYVTGDLRLTTLEGLLSGTAQKYANTSILPQAADALASAGFNIALLNHKSVLDRGSEAAQDTVNALKSAGLSTYGVNVTGAGSDIITVNGLKVAILAYTDSLNSKGKSVYAENSLLVRLFSVDTAVQDIQTVRENGAQFVIVSLRIGKESTESVSETQRETMRKLSSAGADLIIGANPASVLPVELLVTADADGKRRETLVAYSLGSLVTDSRASRAAISGLLLHVSVTVYPKSGDVEWDSITYTPTYVWKQKIGGKTQFRVLSSAEEAPEKMNDEQKKYMNNALKYITKMLTDSPAKPPVSN